MMQNVSFQTVDEFLAFLPEDELAITECLRKLIFECLPTATEKLAYNVPYYKHYRNFCFIWPGSVWWGKKRTCDGVRLGFTNGQFLTDDINYLNKGDRKQVYWKDFSSVREIEKALVQSYIFEAIVVDGQIKKAKNGVQRKVS